MLDIVLQVAVSAIADVVVSYTVAVIISSSQLKIIELFGVPGKLKNGEYTVDQKIQQFFDHLIVRDLFQRSLNLPKCDFVHLIEES